MYTNTLNFGLGEEIDALRDMVRRFAQERIAPLAAGIDRSNEFPQQLEGARRSRSARHHCRGPEFRRHRPGLSRAGASRWRRFQPRLGLGRPLLRRAFQPLRQPDPRWGTAEQKQRFLPAS
jgi:isovaleryl-CoA dehydrogenase